MTQKKAHFSIPTPAHGPPSQCCNAAAALPQRFPAGADRFEGVDWYASPCGQPVLRNAIAYMQCKVRLGMGVGEALGGASSCRKRGRCSLV